MGASGCGEQLTPKPSSYQQSACNHPFISPASGRVIMWEAPVTSIESGPCRVTSSSNRARQLHTLLRLTLDFVCNEGFSAEYLTHQRVRLFSIRHPSRRATPFSSGKTRRPQPPAFPYVRSVFPSPSSACNVNILLHASRMWSKSWMEEPRSAPTGLNQRWWSPRVLPMTP